MWHPLDVDQHESPGNGNIKLYMMPDVPNKIGCPQ